uniref:Uncharacterized protein n=1 Tax=Rhizophora mucronata TaxID=61149 RepID=A0A2P2KBC6_RHIMU
MGSSKSKGELERMEEESSSEEPIVYVNGVRRVLPDGLAHLTLLEYLRGKVFFFMRLGSRAMDSLTYLLINIYFFCLYLTLVWGE